MFLRRVLKRSGPGRFTLHGNTLWVTVGTLSLYISRNGEGVVVDVFRRSTDDDPISSTYAFFTEGAGDDPG